MRCIVKDCKNHEHEGKFVGSLCFPCHEYITKAEGRHSQAYRNTQRTWVGLTDEDIEQVFNSLPDGLEGFLKLWGWLHFAKAVEAKLKEENT